MQGIQLMCGSNLPQASQYLVCMCFIRTCAVEGTTFL